MKSIKKLNLFTTAIVMLFTFSIVGFWGCENDKITEDQSLKYLDIKTQEISKMSEKDLKIMFQAIHRLEISKMGGVYVIKETSGSQVNISEELFHCIKNSFEITNKSFKIKQIKNRIARINSGDPETDCVARAIANMGANASYEEINAYITNLYGSQGVPQHLIGNVIYNFCPNLTFSVTPPKLVKWMVLLSGLKQAPLMDTQLMGVIMMHNRVLFYIMTSRMVLLVL